MERQDVLEGFHQRVGSRFIDPSQPFFKLLKHPLCIFIIVLFQCNLKPSMGFLPILLRQMALNVAILMDRTPLVDQLLPKSASQRLENPFASIGNPEDLPRKPKPLLSISKKSSSQTSWFSVAPSQKPRTCL